MADSKELRAIVGAMTERPWADHHTGSCLESPSQDGHPMRMSVVLLGANEEANQRGIRELANSADALVELVAACERYVIHPTGFHYDILRSALAKVHAVGKEPSDG